MRMTPHKTAIAIAWAVLAAWSVAMYLAVGADWFIPTIWPTAFVAYLTAIILRWERGTGRTTPDRDRSD